MVAYELAHALPKSSLSTLISTDIMTITFLAVSYLAQCVHDTKSAS